GAGRDPQRGGDPTPARRRASRTGIDATIVVAAARLGSAAATAQARRRPGAGGVEGYSGIEVPGPESSNALCSTCTARGTRARSITQEILIGEVEIISMFTPSSASTSNTLAATPGFERMPAPMIDTLPISSCIVISANASPASGRRE